MQSLEIFKRMAPVLEKNGAEIVKKVGCIYHFELRKEKTDSPSYVTVDLKNGNGNVTFSRDGKPDCTFIMLDADFVKMSEGKLKPQ